MRAAGHRTRPHTADLIVEAWAPTREQCLEQAVMALVESFATAAGGVRRRVPVHLGAASDEDLLVGALEQVVYVADVDGAVPVAVHLAARPDGGVEGWFDVVDLGEAEVIGSAPKAVSRHELRVDDLDGQWWCRALVDV